MRRASTLLLLCACALAALSSAATAATLDVNSQYPSITIGDSLFPPTKAHDASNFGYPFKLDVRGCSGLSAVNVRLNGFSHANPDDVNIMLVSPAGRRTILMEHCGGATAVNDISFTLGDAFASALPDSLPLANFGTYKPAKYGLSVAFPSPAPATTNITLSSLVGAGADDPNGEWDLYVCDDNNNGKTGSLTGWHLTITEPAAPANDDFAAAQAIVGALPQSVTGTCFGGTAEIGEPTHADYDTPDFSVWYSWTAPGDGEVVVETSSNTFNTVLGVYTGTAVDQLTEVAFNNEKPHQTNHESGLIFSAVSGTTYHIKVDAYDGYSVGDFTLDLSAPVAPTLPATASASGNVSGAFDYAIDADHYPTSYAATGLPPGLTIDTHTGEITGTPTTAGTYPVAVHVANFAGSADQTLTIAISAAPVITSRLEASTLVGQPFTYAITATNSPTSYAVDATYGSDGNDLSESDLTLDTATGVISGTPTHTGWYWFYMRATNADGYGQARLELWVNDSTASVITSEDHLVGMVGQPMGFTITATNNPGDFTADGLPPGLSLTDDTITGTPTTAGTWEVVVYVDNGNGTTVQYLEATIVPASTPVSGIANSGNDCGFGTPAALLAALGTLGWRRRRLGG